MFSTYTSDLNASSQNIRTHNKCEIDNNITSVYLVDCAFSISDVLNELSYLNEES